MGSRSASLFYREGSSDKVYLTQLVPEGDGWIVAFQYGRRGKPLASGRKTASPLLYEKAAKVFDKLVAEKTAKGYTPDESGVAFTATEHARQKTGYQPQLLNPINEEQAMALVREPGLWLLQTKHDGERRGLSMVAGILEASNRRGLRVDIQQPIADAMAAMANAGFDTMTLDGEDMGSWMAIFDIMAIGDVDCRDKSFAERAGLLQTIRNISVAIGVQDTLFIDIPLTPNASELAAILRERRQDGAEGVVLRDAKAPYAAGRPASGGGALKLKFVERATVRVARVTKGKRSVAMEIMDSSPKDGGERSGGRSGEWRGVGSVTIPPNHDLPTIGALIEVEYLYAYPNGSLYQPIYKGLRTDLTDDAATAGQLKYKSA